jgi:N-methylhydantoinase A/oxoprolinase/acetone carboxylase beta subunit
MVDPAGLDLKKGVRMIGLGIDTGGTYTDSVLVELDTGQVLDKAKALTTRHDLTVGMANSVSRLSPDRLRQVKLASISTTLATNSVVEGKGSRVGLIAVGHEIQPEVPVDHFVEIAGGHDLLGNEKQPLDLEAARAFVLTTRDKVDAYAISSYLSVRNPAHEIALKDLVGQLTDKPVVCGRELTAELGFHERTITAVLNARLTPIIRDLIAATRTVLADHGVRAPLMMARGDGSLMSQHVACERPVETLLSGPAASTLGAKFLTHLENALIVDIGGTTTDIAVLRDGRPHIAPDGATVGQWQTRVRAVDMLTAGIGGDSRVVVMDGELFLSPRRAIPLCIAATLYPRLLEKLDQARAYRVIPPLSYQNRQKLAILQATDFFAVTRSLNGMNLASREQELLELLKEHPCSLYEAAERLKVHPYAFDIGRLEEWNVLTRISLTPTDALHVEGSYQEYSVDAARIGVQIESGRMQVGETEFTARVRREVVNKITQEIVTKLVYDEIRHVHVPGCEVCRLILKEVIRDEPNRDFAVSLTVHPTIVGVGAPAQAYLPEVAERLHTHLVVPVHAEVANAIGAVTGSIFETIEILIQPMPGFGFTENPPCLMYAPDERREFKSLTLALNYALPHGEDLARTAAARECALDVHVTTDRADRFGAIRDGWGEDIYLETKLTFTAVGKPGLAL